MLIRRNTILPHLDKILAPPPPPNETFSAPDGDTGHRLEALLAGGQGRGPGPEVDQVLLLHARHLLDHSPQPTLERHQSRKKSV